MAVAMVAGLLAAGAGAQPLNTEKPIEPVTGDAAPLGDEGGAVPAAPRPVRPAATTPPPAGVTARPAPGVQWAEHVSPSFRAWVDGEAPAESPVIAPPPRMTGARAPNVQWAEHVSPSFRRMVEGELPPAAAPADPAIRNRPDAAQRASDLSTVENALDKPDAAGVEGGGAGATAVFVRRVSRAHARAIVGIEGSAMGAELADGISMAPLQRSRAQRALFDRPLPEHGAAPKLAAGPLPGSGPLQEIPPEPRYDGRPLHDPDAPLDDPADSGRTYAVAMAQGDLAGAALADGVSVVHVSQFVKGERPERGELMVYPRSKFRPFGPINSFETVFEPMNVEPLQSVEDPADLSPVIRSAYQIGNLDPPGGVMLPLADNSMIERREWLIRHLNDCCGRNYVSVMHDPLALVLHYNGIFFMPGQTATVIPLAPGMPAW
jgi:hypothetical protein